MNLSKSIDGIPHKWSTSFTSMIYIDKMFLINHYDINIGFFYTVENQALSEMAFEQIEMFFSILMHNIIIISKEDYDNNELKDLENNIFMIPGKVNDQKIGSQIFLKLVNIVGDNLNIDHIVINSVLGKNIEYGIDMDSPELTQLLPTREEWWDDENIKFQPWWLRDDSATYDVLINRDEIYNGEFKWSEMFEKEIEEAKTIDNAKNKFTIINGGKNVH